MRVIKRLTFIDKILIRLTERIDTTRRAFREFLAVPGLIILLFLGLAIGAYVFERSSYKFNSSIYLFLRSHVFADAQTTSNLLGNIAGSIITVTSITITLLLLIVQQTASNMTSQVFDQFLRRRSNQLYFGFFIGLAVYTLITLATVTEPFNPVFAASLAFILTVIALFLLIVLFYSTIHQMRPPVIIAAIHDHTLAAREGQSRLIQRTRCTSQQETNRSFPVHSIHYGFVTDINLTILEELINQVNISCEVVLRVSIGSFVAYRDVIAEIKADQLENIEAIEKKVQQAVHLEQSRDLDHDPAYGIKQLETIAWTASSPAKSNLTPGLQVVYSLRDLLARWAEEEKTTPEAMSLTNEDGLPIVYQDDVIAVLFEAFESLVVIAGESKEHQVLAAVLDAYSSLYSRLPGDWQHRIEVNILRFHSLLDSYVLASSLEQSLIKMIESMKQAGHLDLAALLQEKLNQR